MRPDEFVLVVEDDPDLCNVIFAILNRANYLVVTVGNAEEARGVLRSCLPAAVLTDIFMPDGDGIELERWVREHHPGIPVIAMSGGGFMAEGDVLEMSLKLGAFEILRKPFDKQQLLSSIERALVYRRRASHLTATGRRD